MTTATLKRRRLHVIGWGLYGIVFIAIVGASGLWAHSMGVAQANAQHARTAQEWPSIKLTIATIGPAQGRDAYHAFQEATLTGTSNTHAIRVQRLLPWGDNGHLAGQKLTAYFNDHTGEVRLALIDESPYLANLDPFFFPAVAIVLAGIILAVGTIKIREYLETITSRRVQSTGRPAPA